MRNECKETKWTSNIELVNQLSRNCKNGWNDNDKLDSIKMRTKMQCERSIRYENGEKKQKEKKKQEKRKFHFAESNHVLAVNTQVVFSARPSVHACKLKEFQCIWDRKYESVFPNRWNRSTNISQTSLLNRKIIVRELGCWSWLHDTSKLKILHISKNWPILRFVEKIVKVNCYMNGSRSRKVVEFQHNEKRM